jgi:hypothetical protein
MSAPPGGQALAEPATTATVLRRGLLGLAALTIGGLAVELTTERHWEQPSQLIAWAALALLAVALGLLARAGRAWRVRVARLLAAAVVASAVFGIWEHIEANHDAGPLDGRYAATWEALSTPSQWWLAARKVVGPAPPLAPGALAEAGLAVLLATARHPALHGRTRPRR